MYELEIRISIYNAELTGAALAGGFKSKPLFPRPVKCLVGDSTFVAIE